MFRLESYLTPWLLGYLDKYVKLKPEDFQLSLWGGDAVFNKLDLRLDVIESLTNIPITFKSGVIHELRIHIPWTRITSEPVVVTINTLEFVAKLKDFDTSLNTSNLNKTPQSPTPESSSTTTTTTTSENNPAQPIPTGYIQNIISKILFNICIIVNNVIVKFVEDDMVLSFNMKSAEFYSVNELWEKTFVDVNTTNINLKKILQLNDVTICLDKLDNKKNSKISFYQDPLIYRCSIESRLDFKYSLGQDLNNFDNQQLKLIKLNFYCRKFDVSITDQQLPMVIRLIELIQAIVDDNLNLPHQENNSESLGLEINENITSGLKIVEELKHNLEPVKEEEVEEQGWLSWAWSYVPNIISEPSTSNENNLLDSQDIHIIIGCYFDQFNISFKLLQNVSQGSKNSSNFSNFVTCNLKGIGVEVNKKNDFNHIIFGISHINLHSNGECCCKLCPRPNLNEIVFLKGGNEDLEEKTFHYLSNSLFDIETNLIENEKSRDKLGNVDENYGLRRFGAIFMDYLSSQNIEYNTDEELTDVDIKLEINQPDIFSLYFILYSVEINVSANLIHRLCKLYDCSLDHGYYEPYAKNDKFKSDSSTSLLDGCDGVDPSSPLSHSPVKMARKFEKYIPVVNQNFIFKQPVIKFHPYSHFLIAPIASQESNFECYFNLNLNYLFLNIVRPYDEKALFDVVSKLPNPSKKLIYDSYVHNQLTADGLKLSMIINNANFNHETPIIEPCYLEFHFSDVIMKAEMWNKQYFPLNEFNLELPVLNINLSKEIIFIISDYLDYYLFSLLDYSMMDQIKRPFMNKIQMKKSKYRQIIYKRLLHDYIRSTKYNKSEIVRISINDLKAKYSLTKIMQIIQINCNMCNIYLFKNDHTDLVPLFETSNRTSGKNNNIKDFLTLKAQLPLKIDTENSYIPDPLFIYLNLNESSIQIRDDFIKWFNYKPSTKGDSELLNLLVLDLFDDVPNIDKADDNMNLLSQRGRTSKTPSEHFETSSSKKSVIYHHVTQRNVNHDESLYNHKPTLIDTFYDLIKALHIQISIKPIRIELTHSSTSNLCITLPELYAKSSGTKCDLEEELINSKLIELPCTYLRACENTSNKLPWLIELKSLKIDLNNSSNSQSRVLLDKFDFNTIINVKPKYHQYDNLLSSMSIVFNMEINKKIDINLSLDDLKLILDIIKIISESTKNFEFKINYDEIEGLNQFSRERQHSDDDTRSYSSISILKEYDWIDTDESKCDFDDLSTGEVSSSSESIHSNYSKHKPKNLNPVRNLTLLSHKNDEQAKINFSLNVLINSISLNLKETLNSVQIGLNRLLFESDLNQIYQKFEIKLKKFQVMSSKGSILTSETDNFMHLTYTNALVKNLTKQIGLKKTRSLKKKFTKHQKWLSEVNLSLQDFELAYNLNLFETIFKFSKLFESDETSSNGNNDDFLIPIINSCDVPLLNFDLKKSKFLMPHNEKKILLEFDSMSISSQFDNQLIRNFSQNSTSHQIYLKAKSQGLINRPGFTFEDRQYLLLLKNLSLFVDSELIIEKFNLRLIVALPILYGPRLINGYALELNVPDLSVNLDTEKINLITQSINTNFIFEKKSPQSLGCCNLSLVPCDLFMTFEKINLNLSSSMLEIALIQPHVCFFMHENLQKFEVSIYDMSVKSGIMETKPGEPESKTGILSGLFTFRIKNFAHLFQDNKKEIKEVNVRKSLVCHTCFKSNDLNLQNPNDKLSTEIFVERPIRLKINFDLIDRVLNFMNQLDFMKESRRSDSESNCSSKMDFLKYLNLNFLTSQIVVFLDLNENFTAIASLNGLHGKIDTESKNSTGSFKLNDFNLNLNLFENDWNFKTHIFGPMSVNGLFSIDLGNNEVNLYSDFGSFSISFNRRIFDFFNQFQIALEKYFEKSIDNDTIERKRKSSSPEKFDQYELNNSIISKHEDDLRNGSFTYKIIDDNYIKKHLISPNQIEECYPHFILPLENEIVCLDDLTNQDLNTTLISSVCWKYPTKRSLINLKIQPLPFIGSQEIKSSIKFKFYLEFLNESSKKFDLLTEFEIEEGVQTNVLEYDLNQCVLTDLIWSKTWRIRLSNEAKKFIFASSLLASTRIDSLELEHSVKKFNLDLKISNIEFKLNKIQKFYNHSDLSIVNINDFYSKICHLNLINQKMSSINAIGQLGIDYCEYQFGTYRPLIDPLRFKLTTRITDKINVQTYIDTVNLLISQSTLITFKSIENEFSFNKDQNNVSSSSDHYFLILNDTNLDLSIKQYDTEETCSINSGSSLPYIWRTHKKLPLLQIYLPKYKKYSQKFTLNNYTDKSFIQEVKIELLNGEFLSLLINLDSDMCRKKATTKVVLIQAKFFLCNYLNFPLEKLCLNYGKNKDLKIEKINGNSRSWTSYELLESNRDMFDFQELKIGDKNLKINSKELSEGILWSHEEKKFWINLHFNEQLGQITLILSPLYVLCSYLPYDLTLSLNNESKILSSNSCSFYNSGNERLKIDINDSDNVSNVSKLDIVSKSLDWYDQKVEILTHKNLNPNQCDFYKDKKLLIHDPFKYCFVSKNDFVDKIDVNLKANEKPTGLIVEKSDRENIPKFLQSKFLISKSNFWPLSQTLRINIRPECLLLNKSEFNIRVHEEKSECIYEIDSHCGQLCLSDSESGKKLKFCVIMDEYSLQNEEKVNLEKHVVEYESEWIEIKDEPVSPFYRERLTTNIIYMNKCWIDLKLYPKNTDKSRYEYIYLILNSEDRNFMNKNLSEFTSENLSLLNESTYRLLKIEPKFKIKNKLNIDLNLIVSNSYKLLNPSLLRTHVATEKNEVKKLQNIELSYVLNRKNMFLLDHEIDHGIIEGVNFLIFENSDQSKCVVLTTKEKPLKQLNSQNENLLISRQCLTLKIDNSYESVIVTQKLLVNQNGQLVIVVNSDREPLVTIKNELKTDVYVWPRLSTNFIFENYLKNCCQNSLFRNSIMYMHKISSNGGLLKYNYDFLGTDHFPIENLNEQIVFMFADDNFDLSQNLCKIYADKIRVQMKSMNFFYVKKNSKTRVLSLSDDFDSEDSEQNLNFPFDLSLCCERLTLALNNDFTSNFNQIEILRLTVDNLGFGINENLNFEISLSHLQLDNQMYDEEKYDFPVVLIPRDVKKLKNSNINYSCIFSQNFVTTRDDFLNLKFNLFNSNLETLEILLKPFDLYLEDFLITDLIKLGFEYTQLISDPSDLSDPIELDLSLVTYPLLKIKKFNISKIDSLITLQTSVKLYLATYKTPVVFDEFSIRGMPESIQSLPQLINKLTSHYLTSLIFRAGWVIGSLDLIGSPTAFVQQVSNGILDFLLLPYRGVRQNGPSGLVQGFTQGSVSLIRNLSSGTITSMTSFASFISRNMDILSFDPHHLARQESFRHKTSDSIGSGFLQVSSSFLISIMGAIGGLAEQPIQSVHNSDNILKGFSKGLIGLVTKPVGAVAELVNQTGQGLLKITGVSRVPLGELRLNKKPLNKEFSKFNISSTKFIWKLLNGNSNRVNSIIDCVYVSKTQTNLSPCYLVLSDDTLYMMDKNEDMLLRAFYISEIDVKLIKGMVDNDVGLCLTLNSQKVEGFVNEYEKLYENNISRLFEYGNESQKNEVFFVTCSCGVLLKPIRKELDQMSRHVRQESASLPKIHRIQSQMSVKSSNSDLDDNQLKKFFFYIDPRVSDNFISIFNCLKRKASNKGFQY